MIKYLLIHAILTFTLFTIWVNNLRISSDEVGEAPLGLAIIFMIFLAVCIPLALLFRRLLQDRNSISIGFVLYLLLYQLIPILFGKPWLVAFTNPGSYGMINRAFVFTPLVIGLLTVILIFLREPKQNGTNN